jgi:hypothetical protein
MHLLCRNRVKDIEAWRAVFRSLEEAHRRAGLHLEHLWVGDDDPNEVFFIFAIADRAKAAAFMDTPEAARGAIDAGVIDGEFHFINATARY